MATSKLYELTDEHRAQLKPWAERWIKNALRTELMSDGDRDAMRAAMGGLYSAAKLESPPAHRQVFALGPITGAIAASVASGVWWLRENPDKHRAIFGRTLSETEIMSAIPGACRFAVAHAVASTRVEPVRLPARSPKAKPSDAATDAATSAADLGIETFLVRCATGWQRLWNGGNHWSGWVSYLSFFRHVAKLDLPVYERFQHYESAAIHGSHRYMHARFWIVCDFPEFVGRDKQNSPHSLTGPQMQWRDGLAIHFVHGMRVPANIIESPELITVARIDNEKNGELRRVMVEIYGQDRYLRDCGAKLVDEMTDGHGQPVRLWRREWPDGAIVQMVELHNSTPDPDGTRRVYFKGVHPELRPMSLDENDEMILGEPQNLTAHNAVASTYGKRGDGYRPSVET
jgi:hypothetical protein